VLGAELRHVEADVCALVTEEQLGHGLREFGLADAGGAGEERDAAGPAAATAAADPRGRALHNVQHVHDGMVLPDHATPDDVGSPTYFVAIDLAPGVLGHADLVAPNGLGDVLHRNTLGPGELRDGTEVDQQHALCGIHQVGHGRIDHRWSRLAGAWHAADERRCDGAPRRPVGRRDRDVAEPGVVDRQPVGEVSLPLGDPDHAVVAGRAAGSDRPRFRQLAEHERTGEERLLLRRQRVVPDDEARGEVGDQGYRGPVQPDYPLERGAKQLHARRSPAVRRSEPNPGQERLDVAWRAVWPRQHREAGQGIVADDVGVARLAEGRRQDIRQRDGDSRPADVADLQVPHVASQHELALEREEAR